jgi:hypothetical protein
MESTTHEKLKSIKQSFRLLMSGPTSQSMRSKGFGYKINWGVQLPQLREMAVEYGKDYDLAAALWKEDIRECKILATMIMPADQMLPELADVWMEQTPTQEIAELCAMNLYQHLDYAPVLAFEWIASDQPLRQLCGYHILARLFRGGQVPNERGINEFLDQVHVVLQAGGIGVRHAAMNSLNCFCELGPAYEQIAKSAMRDLDIL